MSIIKKKLDLAPFTLRIFIGLCELMDENNQVHGYRPEVSEQMGVSIDTLRRHAQELEELGMISTGRKVFTINKEYAERNDLR